MIHAFPQARLSDLFTSPSVSSTLAGFSSLHDSGRSALYWALRSVPNSGDATVWLPSFHCGVEVQATIDAGFQPAFYSVNPDLTIDYPDLKRKLNWRPAAVLLIHYFGFPQLATIELQTLCERLGCVLIEDCAHALFSSDHDAPLGGTAPLAIFSFQKTLPLYDGGAILARREWITKLASLRPAQNSHAVSACVKAEMTRALGPKVRSAYRRIRWGVEDGKQEIPVQGGGRRNYSRSMSGLSRRLASAADGKQIVAARRRNFLDLDQRLRSHSEYLPVFEKLPPGVCPLFLPIRVAERTQAQRALSAVDVGTFRFGANPHPALDPEFAESSRRLRDEILCLPIHQQLSADDIAYLASAICRLGVLQGASWRRQCPMPTMPQ